jgi:predicted ATPase
VHGLIAARLDTLTAERKRLLQDAAVVGTVFWADAVTQMADQDHHEVRAALGELARKELIRQARRSSLAGQAEYAFAHTLIREVCYAQIPRAERAQRHPRAAAWIEAMAGSGPPTTLRSSPPTTPPRWSLPAQPKIPRLRNSRPARFAT